ncbi:MAG: hypothetical protein GEV06_26720 [Luteitalea sp.]|nr:hypothetical protein [Luteitalea sp.]
MAFRGKYLWGVLLFAIIGLVLLWSCPGGSVRGAQTTLPQPMQATPFDAALARFDEQFEVPAEHVVEPADTKQFKFASAETRTSFIESTAREATFLVVAPDGLSTTQLTTEHLEVYEEFLDAIIDDGDGVYTVTWTIRQQTFTNAAIATSDARPKFEPVLYTLPDRSEPKRPDVVARYAALHPFPVDVQPTPNGQRHRDAWSLRNLLGATVASAALEIRELGSTLEPEARTRSLVLWTIEHGPVRSAASRRGRCLDAVVDVRWASFFPNVKIRADSRGVEFAAAPGLVLATGNEPLRAGFCR